MMGLKSKAKTQQKSSAGISMFKQRDHTDKKQIMAIPNPQLVSGRDKD
jgi:hypothetical protein